MASQANSTHPNQLSTVVTPPVCSPPLGASPRTRTSFPSRPLSTYSIDTTLESSTGPYSFPPRPVHSREGTGFTAASSKLHSRTHSVEFLVAHGRSSKAISQPPPPLQVQSGAWFGGLIKPPVVRQFLHNGHLYKEAEERATSHFELFADLVFVAVIHILGEVAAEEATLWNALKFVIMLWPLWSIWTDMRSYLNVSGTDDAIQRIYILLTSILLIGYTAHSASIELHQDENGHISIPSQGYEALQAGTGFFLVAKGVRLLQLLWYAWYLPKFRSSHLVQVVFTLIPSVIFFRLFNVDTLFAAMEIFILGMSLDLVGKYAAGILVSIFGADGPNKHHLFIPALEIGHVIERTTAFYVLVAGEILMGVSYIATESEIGMRDEWVRCCLGVILAFWLCWLYFDVDSCRVFCHALRRHWFSSITWTQLHLPLCASVIIVAAALHKMILKSQLEQGLRWYFGFGMSVATLSLAGMGFLHQSLDRPGSGLVPRWARLSFRVFVGVAFACFPLYDNTSSVFELLLYTSTLSLLCLAETLGKIGTVGNDTPVPQIYHGYGNLAILPESAEAVAANRQDVRAVLHEGEQSETDDATYRVGRKEFKREELTAYEKGEEDMGGGSNVGVLRAITVRRGQRTGFAAF